jgi:tetrahydromethanopterin S-methyltransferase subunit G
MTLFFKKYKRDLIGITLGAVAGFLYWKFVGCSSGTCMITSKPINSTLYGAVMGFLVAGIFKIENKNI